MIITNFTTFLNFDEQINPEDSLHTAIRYARFQAASERRITSLSFDGDAGTLVVDGGESFKLSSNFGKMGVVKYVFTCCRPLKVWGQFPDAERSRLETENPGFAPDRSSNPFAVEIDTGKGKAKRFTFDPFSSLVRSGE